MVFPKNVSREFKTNTKNVPPLIKNSAFITAEKCLMFSQRLISKSWLVFRKVGNNNGHFI